MKNMTKKEKVDFVIKTLRKLYPTIPTPLDHSDHLYALDRCFNVSSKH